MDIKFKYQGCTLENPEAAALMKAAKAKQPFEIDLETLIDVKIMDSDKLFSLSVEQKSSALASLAFKLATSEKATPKYSALVKNKPSTKKLETSKDPLDIVEEINKSVSYRSAGAALLLHLCTTTDYRAIRDIAVEFVNKCSSEYRIKSTSAVYRGFKKNANKVFEPTELSPETPRRDSFYVCPLYISLRSGLLYCDSNGLLSLRQQYSCGSRREDASSKAEAMKRMFYTFKLTDKGNQVKEMWGDIETYLVNFYKSRQA
jgi:hypothetical protein